MPENLRQSFSLLLEDDLSRRSRLECLLCSVQAENYGTGLLFRSALPKNLNLLLSLENFLTGS